MPASHLPLELEVDCPKCGSIDGEPCTMPGGDHYPNANYSHKARKDSLKLHQADWAAEELRREDQRAVIVDSIRVTTAEGREFDLTNADLLMKVKPTLDD